MNIRERCFQTHGRECIECGSDDDLHVHHVNGNPKENGADNLRPLCSECHTALHQGELEIEGLTAPETGISERSQIQTTDIPDELADTAFDLATGVDVYRLQRSSGKVDALSVTIPNTIVEKYDLQPGDEVAIARTDANDFRVILPTDSDDGAGAKALPEMRTVQQKGEVTLPKEWRDEHGVEHGDEVAIRELDDGSLEIIPPN